MILFLGALKLKLVSGACSATSALLSAALPLRDIGLAAAKLTLGISSSSMVMLGLSFRPGGADRVLLFELLEAPTALLEVDAAPMSTSSKGLYGPSQILERNARNYKKLDQRLGNQINAK